MNLNGLPEGAEERTFSFGKGASGTRNAQGFSSGLADTDAFKNDYH